MLEPYALTPSHRLTLATAFQSCPRVDTAIDCAIEGQLGRALVDSVASPTVFAITVGPFWYFAGDAEGPAAEALLHALPAYGLLMPSTPGWRERAQAVFGPDLRGFPRYSFATERLNVAHLQALLATSPHGPHTRAVDVALVSQLAAGAEPLLDLSDFDSAEDFVARSLGYTVLADGVPIGAAYGSLVNSRGLEVSVFVAEPFRRRGVATALAAGLVLACLRRGLRPNWDAANPESCALAEKLGFVAAGTYEAFYHL